jgi:hypothetical protein
LKRLQIVLDDFTKSASAGPAIAVVVFQLIALMTIAPSSLTVGSSLTTGFTADRKPRLNSLARTHR